MSSSSSSSSSLITQAGDVAACAAASAVERVYGLDLSVIPEHLQQNIYASVTASLPSRPFASLLPPFARATVTASSLVPSFLSASAPPACHRGHDFGPTSLLTPSHALLCALDATLDALDRKDLKV